MITTGDILEMKNGKAFEVLEGYSDLLIKGELLVIEIDEDNIRIGEPFVLKINASTPIIDIIR
ncbi:hypothetical protein MHH60_23090 [Paenibacillus sp. FSL H7-0716]|uniref:Uncharacterized protein n=1 Tax=Paenibacillus odorifer TaxID=189426 RepID=A0AB36J2H5_9BACL|nr:hypothetical protein [Paenibacillus odorifer]OME09669.1 hypothetical protein BSK47_31915 [Paenibacillus odorifer]